MRAASKLSRALWLFALAALALAIAPRGAATAPASASARGIDVWVHGPAKARGGAELRLTVQALGFPRLASMVALDGAEIVASWDAESLARANGGARPPASAPAPVTTTSDAEGRAIVALRVPEGPEGDLVLVLTARHGDKERTRELSVKRTASRKLRLFLSDEEVVPGSEVAVWAYASDLETEEPKAHERVEVELLEGGVVRHRREGRTDASGTLLVRLPVPREEAPGLSWRVTAELGRGSAGAEASAQADLRLREERPGTPSLALSFDRDRIAPKERTPWQLRLRDATGAAVAAQPVWVWTGPRGTAAPAAREDFEKVATRLLTDADGYTRGELVAPPNVPLRGSEMLYVARTVLDGQDLEQTGRVAVARAHAWVDFSPEAGELVPGLEQTIHVEIHAEGHRPVKGRFSVRGDGLATTLETDAEGKGSFGWKVPRDVGAKRDVGPCSGNVAAALTLEPIEAAVEGQRFAGALEGFDGQPLCLGVDREATHIVRPARRVVRAGDELEVAIVGGVATPATVLLRGEQGGTSTAIWVDRGAKTARLRVPEGAFGMQSLDLATAEGGRPSKLARARVLALPRSIPALEAKVTGGRVAPNGEVTVHAKLSDGAGKPLRGAIAAIVVDAFGGGSVHSMLALDAGDDLCRRAGVDDEDCEAFLRATPDVQDRLAGPFPASRSSALAPLLDPGASLEADVAATFRAVVQSLEGALYQASHDVALLPDVRRVSGGKHSFNPELMRLVTDALPDPPLTPGGEPLALADLVSIDPQITYDAVARRITRLKLFEVLSAVRELRQGEALDPAEPIFKDPNALLRRLVRDGRLEEGKLLDPWGGRLQFVTSREEVVPFLSVVRGFELRSPGPDGRVNTGDDVRSPFERVLRSGTPYANAVDEDRVVDARWDMRVADSTVEAWSTLLKEATGTELGGIGLGTIGTIGHGSGTGSGYGSGSGRLGGAHRVSYGVAKGIHHVMPPTRTDERGELVFTVPLGAEETTWRIALVGLPDGARPATTHLDVASALPMSVKVDAGARWIDGDRGEALVQVRNRTDAPLEVALSLGGEGTIRPGLTEAKLVVPARGAASTRVPLEATAAGAGALRVAAKAAGVPADELTHRLEVAPAGELVRVARTVWLDAGRSIDLSPWALRAPLVPAGPAEIVVEGADLRVVEAALGALDPRGLDATDALADAMFAAALVFDRVVRTDGEQSPLAKKAADVRDRAADKLRGLAASRARDEPQLPELRLSRRLSDVQHKKLGRGEKDPTCPDERVALGAPEERLIPWLDGEPITKDGVPRECWTTFVAATTNRLVAARDPELLARGALALSATPHRAADARLLFEALEERVLTGGRVSLAASVTRAGRASVLAALLVGGESLDGPARARVAAELAVQRDVRGSFGSPEATRAAVQAVLARATRDAASAASKTPRFSVRLGDEAAVERSVGPARFALRVPDRAGRAEVSAIDGAVVARIERTFLRPFTVPAEPSPSPLAFVTRWPEPSRGEVGVLRVDLHEPETKRGSYPVRAELRVPLPPGAALASKVDGVRQVQGALRISQRFSGRATLSIPLRFSLAGRYTLAEATATSPDAPATIARAPARPLVVKERPGPAAGASP